MGISLPEGRGGADAFLSLSCPLASEGLANTAVFGKQKPSTSRCCLDSDSSEGRAWAGLFCLLFSKFFRKKKKKERLWLFFIQIPLLGEGAGREKQHGLLHVKMLTMSGSRPGKNISFLKGERGKNSEL